MWLFVVRWKELMKRVDCESGSVEVRAPKDDEGVVDDGDDGLVRDLLLVKIVVDGNAVVGCEAWVLGHEYGKRLRRATVWVMMACLEPSFHLARPRRPERDEIHFMAAIKRNGRLLPFQMKSDTFLQRQEKQSERCMYKSAASTIFSGGRNSSSLMCALHVDPTAAGAVLLDYLKILPLSLNLDLNKVSRN